MEAFQQPCVQIAAAQVPHAGIRSFSGFTPASGTASAQQHDAFRTACVSVAERDAMDRFMQTHDSIIPATIHQMSKADAALQALLLARNKYGPDDPAVQPLLQAYHESLDTMKQDEDDALAQEFENLQAQEAEENEEQDRASNILAAQRVADQCLAEQQAKAKRSRPDDES